MKDIRNCTSDICFNPLTLFQPSIAFVRTLSPVSCANPLEVVSSLPNRGHFLVRTLSPGDKSLLTVVRDMVAELTSLRERGVDERFLDKIRYFSIEDEGEKLEENLQPWEGWNKKFTMRHCHQTLWMFNGKRKENPIRRSQFAENYPSVLVPSVTPLQ